MILRRCCWATRSLQHQGNNWKYGWLRTRRETSVYGPGCRRHGKWEIKPVPERMERGVKSRSCDHQIEPRFLLLCTRSNPRLRARRLMKRSRRLGKLLGMALE